jgi:DNA-directed RNA polymerase specialized sigma24 family protein
MGRLKLFDIDDAARFVGAIATRTTFRLTFHDREDLEQFLLVELWRLSERYEPGGISFSTLAGTTLRRRLVDWQRSRFGRTKWQFADHVYERPRVELVSLDDPERDPLGPSLAGRGVDNAEPGLAADLRSLQARARRPRGRKRRLDYESA